jgi:hypothetical protein
MMAMKNMDGQVTPPKEVNMPHDFMSQSAFLKYKIYYATTAHTTTQPMRPHPTEMKRKEAVPALERKKAPRALSRRSLVLETRNSPVVPSFFRRVKRGVQGEVGRLASGNRDQMVRSPGGGGASRTRSGR